MLKCIQVDVEQKIKDAPDSSYEIGVFLGSMLPFVVLIVTAYLIYSYNKKRMKNNE